MVKKHHNCRVCHSPRREDIEQRLVAAVPARDITQWLGEQGEHISKMGIQRHYTRHMAIVERAKQEMAQLALRAPPTKVTTQAVERIKADLDLLDTVASYAAHLARRLAPAVLFGDMSDKLFFRALLVEMRTAAVQKHELLNGKTLNLNGKVGLLEFLGQLPPLEAEGVVVPSPVDEKKTEPAPAPPAVH